MSAISKTKSLERKDLNIDWLHPNEDNPNKMGKRDFDLLCDNIEKVGITDPILVKRMGKKNYRIVGGHHRWEAAKYLGFKEVPCTIITDANFDDEMESFQVVRHNMIKGKLDPESFMKMYKKYEEKYGVAELQELFGFSDEDEFKKLVNATAKSLPKEMQKEFKDAALELKTIDELSALLNRMFTNFGDTLNHGYMIIDYGGKKSVWLRATGKTMKSLDLLGEICVQQQRTMDDIVGGIVQLIASGKLNKSLAKIVEKTSPVVIDSSIKFAPTADNLDKMNKS